MRRTLAAATLALLLFAGGCGNDAQEPGVATAGGSTGSAQPSPSSSVDRVAKLRAFAQCERKHSIDMTDPDPNGGISVNGKVDANKLKAANQACRSQLPDGGQAPKFNPDQVEALRTFAVCLRRHGLQVPDPDPVTGLIPISDLAKLDRNSPTFKSAEAACHDIRPAFLPGGGA